MGLRGPRSAADVAAFRPQGELIPIDVEAMARVYGDKREVLRSLKRGERNGQIVSQILPNGETQWFALA